MRNPRTLENYSLTVLIRTPQNRTSSEPLSPVLLKYNTWISFPLKAQRSLNEKQMADPSLYDYPSPLAGYENSPPLTDEKAADGKSYVNPQTGILSKSYEKFTEPLDSGIRGGL